MLYDENEIEGMAPWLVIILTLAGGFLRVYLIGSRGLRLEETVSIWLASHTVGEIVQWAMRIDQHPPLYYLLLHAWIGLNGDTPYYTRVLSALFGAATIPLIYLIGKRLSGTITGLAAAVFLALSLFNIQLAQETGMYTLLMFNAAVAIYGLVRLLTDARAARPIGSQFRDYVHAWRAPKPLDPDPEGSFSYRDAVQARTGWDAWISRHRWLPIQAVETDLAWVVLILFSAATALTHSTGVFFILAANIFVFGLLLSQRRKPAAASSTFQAPTPGFQAPTPGNWIKAQVGILILCGPWLAAFFQQASRVDPALWIPRPGWDTVLQALQAFLNPSAPGQISQAMTWTLCAGLGLGLVFYRKNLARFFFLAALFAIPCLGLLIVSIRQPVFSDRALIWITIPLFLLLAAGITQLKFQLLMVVALGIFGTNAIFSTTDYFHTAQYENWIDPARYVANRVEKDDLILFNSARAQIPFDYYFQVIEKKNYLEVEQHGVPDIFASGAAEHRLTASDLPELTALLSGHDRVWLVYSHAETTDPMRLIPRTLAEKMKLIQANDFFGVQVQFYASP
jgi:mannosyltransferase